MTSPPLMRFKLWLEIITCMFIIAGVMRHWKADDATPHYTLNYSGPGWDDGQPEDAGEDGTIWYEVEPENVAGVTF